MSPWWKRRSQKSRVCSRCDANADVQHGLCRHCRDELSAAEARRESTKAASRHGHMPPQPPIEPAHDRPWVHQGGA
jgi:hypothetical protein